jgi:competence protein ComGC
VRALERAASRRQTYSLVLLAMITVIGVVAIFMLLGATKRKSRKMYEDPVVALRDIFARQETLFFMKHRRYATFEELVKEGVISGEVLDGPVQGFLYRLRSLTAEGFEITAEPSGPPPRIEPTPDGPPRREVPRHHYMVDHTHTVRSDAAAVTSMSPILWSPRDMGPR